ncbi:MAG TPA: hypothetical protein VF132_14320, partial [Rudaea sp.]
CGFGAAGGGGWMRFEALPVIPANVFALHLRRKPSLAIPARVCARHSTEHPCSSFQRAERRWNDEKGGAGMTGRRTNHA